MRKAEILVSLFAIAAASPALSQETSTAAKPAPMDKPDAAGLTDIVVTARRVNENAQNVPVAVTALSALQLERQTVRDFKDIQRMVPNLYIREAQSDPTGAAPAIRGQTQPDTPITIDPAVGVYVDDVNYPRVFGNKANIIDVERIEVLRGPQGTLYGKNTTGGAINVITRAPTDELGASLKFGAGNYQSYWATGIVNVPVASGAALRVVGSFSERDKGFVRDALGRDLATESARFIRGKLRLEPTSNLTLMLGADYQRYEYGGVPWKLTGPVALGSFAALAASVQFGTTPAAAAARLTAEGLSNDRKRTGGTTASDSRFRGYGFSLDARWEFSPDLTLRSISAWRHFDRRAHGDQDSSSVEIISADTGTKDNNWTQELQLLGNFGAFDFVAGLYGAKEDGLERSQSYSLRPISPNRGRTLGDIRNRTIGAFTQATWRFATDWSLTGGLRYTSERKEIVTSNGTTTPAGVELCDVPVSLRDNGITCSGTLSDTFSEPAWLISIDHKFDPDVLGYAKVSRGFRGGGQNLRGARTIASFQPFRPELATEYEAGLKSDLFDRTLRLNIAAFYDDLKDAQRLAVVLSESNTAATITTNAASARLYGGEIELAWRPLTGLTIDGSISHTKGKYKRFVDFTGDRSAERFLNPDWQGSISAAYEIQTTAGPLTLQADYYRQSSVDLAPDAGGPAAERTQKAYGIMNMRINLGIEAWGADVALFSRNLLNATYKTSIVGLYKSLGYNVFFNGDPRTFGLEFTMRFGGER